MTCGLAATISSSAIVNLWPLQLAVATTLPTTPLYVTGSGEEWTPDDRPSQPPTHVPPRGANTTEDTEAKIRVDGEEYGISTELALFSGHRQAENRIRVDGEEYGISHRTGSPLGAQTGRGQVESVSDAFSIADLYNACFVINKGLERRSVTATKFLLWIFDIIKTVISEHQSDGENEEKEENRRSHPENEKMLKLAKLKEQTKMDRQKIEHLEDRIKHLEEANNSTAKMWNSNQEKSGTESDQTKQQNAYVHRARHDGTLLNPGLPTLYRLNTDRKYIGGTDGKVRQWTYGRRDKQNKVILLVGERGTGKTTMINTMINYLLGVKFEDGEFYQITEEDGKHQDQSKAQTSEITVYEAFAEENPISLTIIDTPGYGDTEGSEKEKEISEDLTRLFTDKDNGIHYIDAVCFVMKASQNQLSEKQHYIFHSFLSLFGKDIKNNIVFLLTQSDGECPTDALNAIKKAEIHCGKGEDKKPVHFLFNNRQKEERDKEYHHVLKSAWRMGDESMNEFFKLLKEENRKSLQMTLDVLKERRRLGACVSNLKDRINENDLKMKIITEIQEVLRQNRDKIARGEDVEFRMMKSFKVKVPIVNEWLWNSEATCCSVCEENCHEWKCSMAPDPSWCWVMTNGHCTVCTGKCHYSKHVRENKKYELKTEDITMKYYEGSEEKLKSDLEKIKEETSKLLHEAYTIIMNLSEITLKVDSAFTRPHLDFLIPRLKEEGKDELVKNLEDLL
ncbi:uncharacterized protein LOC143737866 [Siphateles boraxobius]|uniref:uncharacterized protein LOC143737866 n=1 Tax=Siphateles boraxobius TaxID=180520 RepID=UPI0040629973